MIIRILGYVFEHIYLNLHLYIFLLVIIVAIINNYDNLEQMASIIRFAVVRFCKQACVNCCFQRLCLHAHFKSLTSVVTYQIHVLHFIQLNVRCYNSSTVLQNRQPIDENAERFLTLTKLNLLSKIIYWSHPKIFSRTRAPIKTLAQDVINISTEKIFKVKREWNSIHTKVEKENYSRSPMAALTVLHNSSILDQLC